VAAAAADCAYAGPAGNVLTAAVPAFCSGGNACASFCALEVQACGSVQMPLPGEELGMMSYLSITGDRARAAPSSYRPPAV
jgi:hypothetical protein